MAEHAWSGLKPSHARVADASHCRPDPHHARHQGSLRGTDQWMPIASSDVESSWGVGCLVPPSAGLEVPSALGVLKRLVPERATAATGPAVGDGRGGVLQHRQGWNRLSIPSWEEGKTNAQRHCYPFDNTPCSESKLDEELTMFESQITRTVSDHFSKLTSRTSSSLSQEIASLVNEKDSGGAKAGSSGEKLTKPSGGEVLKRLRSAAFETDGQGGRGWIHPLKLLVRKGLTLSDVGELGRIIIPKKDAERQSFPRIDTKEGAVLEVEDYSVSKRWYFRFKYWINNKSRMYVLENTGEFIKYHSLQEHDMFCVYEDGGKKLVVCGRKKSKSGNWYPLIEASKFESSPSETPPTTSTTEDEVSSRSSDVENGVAARS